MCMRARGGNARDGTLSCGEQPHGPHEMRTAAESAQRAAAIDAIDRAILDELQRDGRLSNVDLAQRVHLSPSACLRRVKALEDSGVIAQYVALLNPKAVGRHGTSYTIINLESTQQALLESFEQAV